MEKQIDCPTCERMGRVTVITQSGKLTTATCGNCGGEGVIFDHWEEGCEYCAHAKAKQMRPTPLFDAPAWGGF